MSVRIFESDLPFGAKTHLREGLILEMGVTVLIEA